MILWLYPNNPPFIKNKLVSVNFIKPISRRGKIWSLPFRFYPLWIFFLISIETCQDIDLVSITYMLYLLQFWKKFVKLSQIALLGLYLLGKSRASMVHAPKIKFKIELWMIFCLMWYFDAKSHFLLKHWS